VPIGGFKFLTGKNGIQKFQIHKVNSNLDHLPTAHTWFIN